MFALAGRSLAAFFYATALLRFAGRKSISKLTYLDFIIANLMGNIVGYYIVGPIKGSKILMAPAVLISAGIFSEMATVKSSAARKILEGGPMILIKNGKILEKNMAKARYNIGELMMSLRNKGVFDLGEIEFAILEINGRVSVQKKSQNRPVTPKDLGIPTKYEGLSSVLVSEGKIVQKNLATNKLSQGWLKDKLQKQGIKDVKDIFLATLATDGSLYVDLKKERHLN